MFLWLLNNFPHHILFILFIMPFLLYSQMSSGKGSSSQWGQNASVVYRYNLAALLGRTEWSLWLCLLRGILQIPWHPSRTVLLCTVLKCCWQCMRPWFTAHVVLAFHSVDESTLNPQWICNETTMNAVFYTVEESTVVIHPVLQQMSKRGNE